MRREQKSEQLTVNSLISRLKRNVKTEILKIKIKMVERREVVGEPLESRAGPLGERTEPPLSKVITNLI